MSAPHQYHQPNAPDPSADESDSDLELDLQELDPVEQQVRPEARFQGLRGLGTRIPLRNLRVGRLRARQKQDHDEEEDLRGLMHDEDDQPRDSGGSLNAEDDAPLLHSARDGRKREVYEDSAISRLGSTLRIPFLSGNSRPTSPRQNNGIEEGEDPVSEYDPSTNRTVGVGQTQSARFPPNAVSNAKYTPWSFLPRTLYNEFSFFINMYFLLVALSQIIPALRIGYLVTYIAPLAFVISITLGKEAWDDIARRRRDSEANSESYVVLKFDQYRDLNGSVSRKGHTNTTSQRSRYRRRSSATNGGNGSLSSELDKPTSIIKEIKKPSRDLKVGDVVKMGKDQRVPADMIILKTYTQEDASNRASTAQSLTSPTTRLVDHIDKEENRLDGIIQDADKQEKTSEPGGEAFIRTDQLDGETDWKLRLTNPISQALDTAEFTRLRITAGKPDKRVNDFIGTLELLPKTQIPNGPHQSVSDDNQALKSLALTIDNTAWANTVLASNCTVLGVIIYTGAETRQALSTSPSRSKTGLLEYEINSLTKILCILTVTLSFILVALEGFATKDGRKWYISVMRFLILFSTIVPVSLRVNLDMGKTVYAWFIEHDQGIPGTIVRTSTIPEDLGRVEYLLSDKTGTLTQNGKSHGALV
jgi:phospholipid-translocating ATPase